MKLGTVIPYLKKIKKIFELRDTPLEFCIFFNKNQQILLYQQMQIYIEFLYVISNSLIFFEPLKNFDYVSKNGYYRSS